MGYVDDFFFFNLQGVLRKRECILKLGFRKKGGKKPCLSKRGLSVCSLQFKKVVMEIAGSGKPNLTLQSPVRARDGTLAGSSTDNKPG